MQIEVRVDRKCPQSVVDAVNSSRNKVLSEALVPYLQVDPQVGPAEFNVLECAFADGGGDNLCEVWLDGASVKDGRDYAGAVAALEEIYAGYVKAGFGEGQSVQVRVVLKLDAPAPGTNSELVESEPVWVTGEAAG